MAGEEERDEKEETGRPDVDVPDVDAPDAGRQSPRRRHAADSEAEAAGKDRLLGKDRTYFSVFVCNFFVIRFFAP